MYDVESENTGLFSYNYNYFFIKICTFFLNKSLSSELTVQFQNEIIPEKSQVKKHFFGARAQDKDSSIKQNLRKKM